MSINILTLRPWKLEKHQRVPPLEMKKIFVSDFDEIQNMQSLWPKDFTHKIWVESETKNFSRFKGGTLWWFSENQKNTKGSPLWKKKIFLSPISLKFFVWDPETIRISDFEFHQKNFFLIFFHFYLMLEDPQKFSTSDFSNFLVKNVKSSFTGSWQIPKGTKSWNLVNLPLTAR